MNLLLDLATTLPLDQLALDSSLFQGLGQSLAVLPTFEDVTGILQSMNLYAVWAACFGVLLLCGFGLPIPEDITLVLCGYMTWMLGSDGSYGNPNVLVALAIAMGLAGVLLGDAIMFTLGQRYGKYLMVRWPFASILGSGRKELAEGFLKEKGPQVLFSARFMPGLRSVVFFTSGTLGIGLPTFLLFDGLAAVLSVPALIGSSWYFGENINEVIAKARQAEHGILLIILIGGGGAALKYWLGQRKKAKAAGNNSPPTR